MKGQGIKLYTVLRGENEELRAAYRSRDAKAILKYIVDKLPPPQQPLVAEQFRVTSLPSGGAAPDPKKDQGAKKKEKAALREKPDRDLPRELVVGIDADADAQRTVVGFHEFVGSGRRADVFVGSGADLPFAATDHWCPSQAADPIFADRAAAERLLRVPYLRDTKRLKGNGVNVVIVDQGLDKARLGAAYADGWPVGTGTSTPSIPGEPHAHPDHPYGGHGMMVARNILSVAPEVRLFDLPMVPLRITNIQDFFLNRANAALRDALDGIAGFRARGEYPGPWILVNAWGVYDRKTEFPVENYTNNPGHPFHTLIQEAVDAGIDVLFAAGNCGQFCPDGRCGRNDRGPGHSILGASSYGMVLTVGAVRADMLWLGYSSQGPGQPLLEKVKPDLCASSQFHETFDDFTVNVGTSAATALTAGVVAALRGNWDSGLVSPGKLKQILNATARAAGPGGWDNRYGAGILDAESAYKELDQQFP